MARIASAFAGAAAIALAASAGPAAADCFGAHSSATASVSQPQDSAAMSTHDGRLPPLAEETAEEAQVAEAPTGEAPAATEIE